MTALLDVLPFALAGTGFALGARHGLDGDHIAALTDLTAPRPEDEASAHRHARRGMGPSFWYCAGQDLVLAVLGMLILALGLGLPTGMDVASEYVAGLALVTLAPVALHRRRVAGSGIARPDRLQRHRAAADRRVITLPA